MDSLTNLSDKAMDVLNNEYVLIVLGILVTVYASMASVALPSSLKTLFKNDVFRVVFLSLLLMHRFDKSPHIALSVALVFVITMHYIAEDEKREAYENIKGKNSE